MAKIWISISLAMIALQMAEAAVPVPVPAIFIFGDSTADVGTNNYLPESQAKANFPFNGIDFRPLKPTGRFSNGCNTADLIVRLMGYKKSPPPFLSLLHNHKSAFKRNFLRGVNFASGGAGLLDTTGQIPYKKVIPLGEQIKQFAAVRRIIVQVMGPSTSSVLAKSIFLISVGSNDIFEYFGSNLTRSKLEFMALLMFEYGYHSPNLLDLGARKLGIISVPPIGCCPYQRERVFNTTGTGGSMEEMNEYAKLFFKEVEYLLQNWSSEYKGLKYSLGNAYEMTMDIIDNPLAFGFKDISTACCGKGGRFNGESPCNQTTNLCPNHNKYLFWDRFHPTQAAAKMAALSLYGGPPRLVTPMNFNQLIG